MSHVNEYYRETQCITRQLDRVKNLHSRYATRANNLTRLLQTFFKLFTRSDELVTIIADYCQRLTFDVQAVQAAYEKHRRAIEQINTRLLQSNVLLTAITEILHNIRDSARSFISSAQTLASLAKNTEIKAHHAQKEGTGLAIIAQECLHLAEQAQLPFENFHTHIQQLEEIAAPVIAEVKSILELSERSQTLLMHSFQSLDNLDDAIASLQRIAIRLEEHSSLSNQLRERIAQGIDTLKKQLCSSTDIIEDLSVRSEHLTALAQTLKNLSAPSSAHGVVNDQLTMSVRESIQALDAYPTYTEPPISDPGILKSVKIVSKRITELGSSMNDLMNYKSELDYGTKDVIQLRTNIEQFLTETLTTSQHLVQFAFNLDKEIRTIESLISNTNSIFVKIKTLSVYAKIEEARSVTHQNILAPIVSDYAHLEQKTEKAFRNLTPLIVELKLHTQRLRKAQKVPRLEIIKHPDYSKIKLFLDDMMRVFEEEVKLVRNIVQNSEKLLADSTLFRDAWSEYATACSRTAGISTQLSTLLKAIEAEAPATTRKK